MDGPMSEIVEHLRRAEFLRAAEGMTDGQLLECFVSRREVLAAEALVRRHGPMVWGLCRRVLRDRHDAEDAFQATFLVLVRRAASVVPRERVGNWLYGVAHQTALKARAAAARRKAREKQVAELPEPEVEDTALPPDLRPVLDEELSRLPTKYRAAIVLCDLEGKARKDAARQLGLPEGTLAGHLSRGRVLLAKRLARRGFAISGGALATALTRGASAGVPALVNTATIKTVTLVAAGPCAAGMIPPQVAALTEGVLKAMLYTKLKTGAAVLLVAAVVSVAAGVQFGPGGTGETPATRPGAAVAVPGDEPPAQDLLKAARDRAEIERQRSVARAVEDAKKKLAATLRELEEATGDPKAAREALDEIEKAVREMKEAQAKRAAAEPVWTLDVRFKNPRVVTVDIPGKGRKAVWYFLYEVINDTGAERTFIPELEIVTGEKTYRDQVIPRAQETILGLEDPTAALGIKDSVKIAAAPLPPVKRDAVRRGVWGVALWDDLPANLKGFTLYLGGASNAWAAEGTELRRKTLKITFETVGDELRLAAPPEWVYRVAPKPPPTEKEQRQAEIDNLKRVIADVERHLEGAGEITATQLLELEQLRNRLKALESAKDEPKPPPAKPADPVKGTVQEVLDGDQLLLNIGEDAGVKKGQTFEVYRLAPQPKYIGQAQVIAVGPRSSVAKLTKGKDAKVGDQVSTPPGADPGR